MSGFRDTFTKEDSGEKMLDYDESAFYYFAVVVTSVILIPLGFSLLCQLCSSPDQEKQTSLHKNGFKVRNCTCSLCKEKDNQKQLRKKKASRITAGFVLKFLIFIILSWIMYWIIIGIMESPEGIKQFDPFEILGVDHEATEKQINKAFRELSRIYHPDKNKGDNVATGKYMQITKAHETLTNELARENWKKYGNPDGPTALKFAIGLPRFLLDTENHVPILVAFFLIFIVLMPGLVLYWMKSSQKCDKNGVLIETVEAFRRQLNENMTQKKIIVSVSTALEFRDFPTRRQDQNDLGKYNADIDGFLPKRKNIIPTIRKIIVLLVAYLKRRQLSQILQQDLELILQHIGNLIESMVENSYIIGMHPRGRRIGMRVICFMIELAQLATQALFFHDSNLLMLPHINGNNIKDISTKKKDNVLRLKQNPSFEKLQKRLGDQKMADVQQVLNVIPDLEVTAEAFVEGSEDIVEGDLMTVRVTINRLHLQEDEEQGFIHAPFFPFNKYENLWVLIGSAQHNLVFHLKKLTDQGKVVVDESFKIPVGNFPIPLRPGAHTWDVIVKSDSYYDIDRTVPLQFTVKSEAEAPKEIYVHPDDENLEYQPSWFQQIVSGAGQQSESSDEEEIPELDEEEEDDEVD